MNREEADSCCQLWCGAMYYGSYFTVSAVWPRSLRRDFLSICCVPNVVQLSVPLFQMPLCSDAFWMGCDTCQTSSRAATSGCWLRCALRRRTIARWECDSQQWSVHCVSCQYNFRKVALWLGRGLDVPRFESVRGKEICLGNIQVGSRAYPVFCFSVFSYVRLVRRIGLRGAVPPFPLYACVAYTGANLPLPSLELVGTPNTPHSAYSSFLYESNFISQ